MLTSSNIFASLPNDAVVWVRASDMPLSPQDQNDVLEIVEAFLRTWTSHDRPVIGEAAITHNHFLIVAAHIPGGEVSGCGIDKLIHRLEELQLGCKWSWLEGLYVVFKNEQGQIEVTSRDNFRTRVASGNVNSQTLVYDTSVSTLTDLREFGLERKASESWHARVFNIGTEINA